MSKRVLGVIGGMGPLASARFCEILSIMQSNEPEQAHVEVIMHSKPSIPDRTAFILGRSEKSPLPEIIEVGKSLIRAGAEVIALPCVTAHYFYDEIAAALNAKVINIVDETASRFAGKGRVGLLCTEGTIAGGFLQAKFENAVTLPKELQHQLSGMIYNYLKRGKPADAVIMLRLINFFKSEGAAEIVLACTELSLAKRDLRLGEGFTDMLEILAEASLRECR